MKTQADVDRVQTALESERDEHKVAKKRLRGLNDDDTGEAFQDLKDKVEDLEAKLETAGKDKVSDDEIQKRVDAQVKLQLRPIERENTKLKETNEEQMATIGTQAHKINSGLIRGDVTEVLGIKELGINPDALPDIEIYLHRPQGGLASPVATLADVIVEVLHSGEKSAASSPRQI